MLPCMAWTALFKLFISVNPYAGASLAAFSRKFHNLDTSTAPEAYDVPRFHRLGRAFGRSPVNLHFIAGNGRYHF